jgi:predicted nuclease of predicted toxin-antitoxin system
MLRLLIDQDLDHDILRGLIRRVPGLEAVTALEIGMSEASDPELLVWAAEEKRVIVTHDRKTMPIHAAVLIAEGKTIAGLCTKCSKSWTCWSPVAKPTSG